MEHLIEPRMPDDMVEGISDPDAQATVSDFVDYTEYLPADLRRSLCLIRSLDETYQRAAQAVHELTRTYGALPTLPEEGRPSPVELRKRISDELFRAISARECAYAEACRLYDVVDRHFDRLGSIRTKLESLTKTVPSLKEAASQAAPAEPEEKKHARPTRSTAGPSTPPRLTLRLKSENRGRDTEQAESPGVSQRESSQAAEKGPIPLRLKVSPKARKGRTGHESPAKDDDSTAGTTSRGSQSLKPPPEGASLGSEHLPWLRLTDWELSRLRKRMKKNNVWQPSEVMVHRELAVQGRGWENYQKAKQHAHETGEEFIDCDDIEHNYAPGQSIQGREIQAGKDTKLINRGMKLNEAKKLKRENLAREAAAQAASDKANSPQGAAVVKTPKEARGSRTKHANTKPDSSSFHSRAPASAVSAHDSAVFEDAHVAATAAAAAAAADLPTTSNAPQANGNASKDRDTSSTRLTRKRKLEDLEPVDHRGAEAASSKNGAEKKHRHDKQTQLEAANAPDSRRTRHQRGQSPTSTGAPTATHTGGRRNKRPAPGPVTSSQDGGAAVSVGRRKTKPKSTRNTKKDTAAAQKEDKTRAPAQEEQEQQEDSRIDEDGMLEPIDPNEPRYCICGDVSFGTMICCEDNDCDKEWFHLECVGLTEPPSRTAKWYCPECRTKISKAAADGIVRTGRR